MADRTVTTRFVADTSMFSGPAQALASQAEGLGKTLGALQMAAGGVFASIAGAGIQQALTSMAKVHSDFEDTTISMGGFLSALGMSKNFESGMEDAAEAMQAITVAAAKLPGEAEDYIAVFKAGLPVVQGAIGGTLEKMYTFTNKLTAITSTLRIESSQVARDIPRLLDAVHGGAGGQNKTWKELLPFMKKIEGQANLTSQKFNAMNQEARGALLQQLVNGEALTKMVDASGNTWSAQTGAWASNTRAVMRTATGPLFEQMKNTLGDMNKLLYTDAGKMTGFTEDLVAAGQIASTKIVSAFKTILTLGESIGKTLTNAFMLAANSPAFQNIHNAFKSFKSGGIGGMAAVAGGAAAGGPAGLVIGALVDGISRGNVGEMLMMQLQRTFNVLTRVIDPIQGVFERLTAIGGDFVASVLPRVVEGFNLIAVPLVNFVGGLWMAASVLMDTLRPALLDLFIAIGGAVVGVAAFLHPAIRLLGAAFMWVYKKSMEQFMPAINLVIKAFIWIFNKIASVMGEAGTQMSVWADNILGPEDDKDSAGGELVTTMKAMLDTAKQANTKKAKEGQPPPPHERHAPEGKGGAHNDFRNSKFDITQKFADGFDPDRIAVAFSQDLARLGEQRLQSGFEPVYGIR